jgi:hypothetical protein
MSVLDPRKMGNSDSRETVVKKFRSILSKMVEVGRFHEQDADEAVAQYKDFLTIIVIKHAAEIANFHITVSRMDVLLHSYLTSSEQHSKLWVIAKQLLLSHGRVTIERGFSVNRQIEVEIIFGETVSARRLICCHAASVSGI